MQSYEDIVSKYRKNSTREMIPNGSRSHASVIVENLLLAAADKQLDVKIVSGTLMKSFYEPFAEKISAILKHNKVDVIMLQPVDDETFGNRFIEAVLGSSQNGRVRVCDFGDGCDHFIVVGKGIYRLEIDHNNGEAIANFNDPALGKYLVGQFDQLAKVAVPYRSENTAPAASPVVAA